MSTFSILNPNFNTDRYTTVAVNDGARRFAFLFSYLGHYEGQPRFIMYWPDYEPSAFGFNVNYRITISHWGKGPDVYTEPQKPYVDVDVIVSPKDAIAMVPFRYEQNNYNEFTAINWEPDIESEDWPEKQIPIDTTWYYISVKPWIGDVETGRPDRGYVGSQAAFNILNTFNISLSENLYREGSQTQFNPHLVIKAYQGETEMSMNELKAEVAELYGIDARALQVKATLYIADKENVYATHDVNGNTCPCPSPDNWQSLIDPKPDDFLSQWYESMCLFGWLKFYTMQDGEEVDLIGYRTNTIPVTQYMWGFWMGDATIYTLPNISDPDHPTPTTFNMKFGTMSNFPRVINKTVQQVTNLSNKTDSRAGIVQPVFIRTRDLASIVVHPAVTENICINLDAYKSSVNKFMIRIEDCTFKEYGRTSAGVIFKVVGNQLSGTLKEGTYYILNQDEELVTTGKYQYEY